MPSIRESDNTANPSDPLSGGQLRSSWWKRFPTKATAPFCPSEVHGSVVISGDAPLWKRLMQFAGPGLLVSIGYMDPGNWATDIEAGSRFGFDLLFVVLFSSLAAIVLQTMSMRLGLVSGKDLAAHCREQFRPATSRTLWVLAELAIIATDVAEVLGSALAFKLLFGVSLMTGIGLTAVDTVIVLGLRGKGFRQLEAIILGLIATIGICYMIELYLVQPQWSAVFAGLIPRAETMTTRDPWYLAVGILGATVMPHNLYLHSSLVQTRKVVGGQGQEREALRLATVDTVISLLLAFLVNAAILILAGAAFHAKGGPAVTEIDEAYRLLEPVVGTWLASLLFGIALLASGQSSTFTGTIAGQVILEGFLSLKIPCWQRRLITRGLALLPAMFGVWLVGETSTGKLLVFTQVVLSLQLPFAIYPLIRFVSDGRIMGPFKVGRSQWLVAWALLTLIAGANLWLVYQIVFRAT